jgi:hypothetical protein
MNNYWEYKEGNRNVHTQMLLHICKYGKNKALQDWTGSDGSRRYKHPPDFKKIGKCRCLPGKWRKKNTLQLYLISRWSSESFVPIGYEISNGK